MRWEVLTNNIGRWSLLKRGVTGTSQRKQELLPSTYMSFNSACRNR